MVGKNESLRPLWDATIEVYRVFHQICERNNLRFWAYSGTALGAVRHAGFIPWDDDFDVLMPMTDYLRFLQCAQDELPPYYKVIYQDNTPEFNFMYAKVQDVRRSVSDYVRASCGHPQSEGIFIDVFPYGGVPADTLGRRIASSVWRMQRSAVQSGELPTFRSKVANAIGRGLLLGGSLRTPSDFDALAWEIATAIPFDDAELVGWFDRHSFRHAYVASRQLYDKTVWLPFEDVEVPLPDGYDQVLRGMFGDYMKLPPEDQRVWTHRDSPDAPWKFGPTKEAVR